MFHLTFGVALPTLAIAAEQVTHWSARAYLDPFPSPWIVAIAALVPAANLAGCLGWTQRLPRAAALAANLVSKTISLVYVLLFLPVVPASLILSVIGVGLLPLAPFFALFTAWRLGQGSRAEVASFLIPCMSGVPALSGAARRFLCQTMD